MSATDPGEEFWHDLAAAQNNLDPDASDARSHADSELCDESDDFTPSDDENQQLDGIFSLTSHRRGNEDSDDESQGGAAFDVQEPPSDENLQPSHTTTEPMDIEESEPSQPPKSNSLTQSYNLPCMTLLSIRRLSFSPLMMKGVVGNWRK